MQGAMLLHGSYDYRLVVFSVVLAMFASYAALDLAGRVTAARHWARLVWLAGGACSMGLGIWAMHYVGMLAFSLPVPVLYHYPTVILSLLAALLERMSLAQEVIGSLIMGGGIASMHYIGMDAMRVPAMMEYNWSRVALSVVLAVAAFGYWQTGSPSSVEPPPNWIVQVFAVETLVAVAFQPVFVVPEIVTVIPLDAL